MLKFLCEITLRYMPNEPIRQGSNLSDVMALLCRATSYSYTEDDPVLRVFTYSGLN